MIIIKFFTQINQKNSDTLTTLFEFNSSKQLHRLKLKNQVKIAKKTGSMAKLVDAPDSKSGHFGGVGSIPSTPTILFSRIIKNISNAIKKNITPNAYILKVKPKVSAEIPTTAGPNIAPTKAILDT